MNTIPAAAGSPTFKRINRAMLSGGFSAFALLYCVQPLLPMLSSQFRLTPAQTSWSLSISTLAMAVSLIISSILSDRIGRKRLMTMALSLAAVFTFLSAFAQDFAQLLVLRALLGFALGGMPAVAMAYMSEEVEGRSLGHSMGMYIGGTAVGGMAGRVAASSISDFYSWRLAFALMGAMGVYAAWEFARNLPESSRFTQGQRGWPAIRSGARKHLTDAGLPWLYAIAFLLMGVFVSLFNYIGYRMSGAPFGWGQSAIGALSILYMVGMFSSVWAGRLADRLGRRRVLWITLTVMLGGLLLTLSDAVPVIVLGSGIYTFGFFATHTIASSWVGRRAGPPQALASALYLFFYYLGASVIGSLCGMVWSGGGWSSVVLLLALALGGAALIALRLRKLLPLPEPAVSGTS